MWPFNRKKENPKADLPEGLKEEARRNPGGYVYSIDARIVDPMGEVPFFAITGWHKVDDAGNVEGGFVKNDKYDAQETGQWIAKREA